MISNDNFEEYLKALGKFFFIIIIILWDILHKGVYVTMYKFSL